jgi:outer membrane receptor for ferrienterochelin and colicins
MPIRALRARRVPASDARRARATSRWLTLAILLAFATPARAEPSMTPEPAPSPTASAAVGRPSQARDDDAVHGSFAIAESVVTGTKTPHSVEDAPVPTQVISRDEVVESSTTNVVETLNQVPDIYVQRNQEFGLGASVVRMQGADPNKVAILLDGQRFRGGVDGVVDLRDIPIDNIEQIEIIRGPASSLYGSDATSTSARAPARRRRRSMPPPPAARSPSRSTT